MICRSPRARRSVTARRARPIRRWISWLRPEGQPWTRSRTVRFSVARGSMAYSAVTQPEPVPLMNGGTFSSIVAVARTRVRPHSMRAEPSAKSR